MLVTDDKAGARDLFRSALTGYFATPVYNQYAAWYGFEEEAKLIAEGFRSGDRALTRKGLSDRLVAPVPNPTDFFNVGPLQYVKKTYPDVVGKVAILHGGIDNIDVQYDRLSKAMKHEGFTVAYEKRTGVLKGNASGAFTNRAKECASAGNVGAGAAAPPDFERPQ